MIILNLNKNILILIFTLNVKRSWVDFFFKLYSSFYIYFTLYLTHFLFIFFFYNFYFYYKSRVRVLLGKNTLVKITIKNKTIKIIIKHKARCKFYNLWALSCVNSTAYSFTLIVMHIIAYYLYINIKKNHIKYCYNS